jgi:hypothetical protein
MSKGGGGVNIPSNYTIAVGSTNTPLQVDVDIDKIAPVTVNSNLAITQPIVSQSTSNSTSTATTNSTANVDLKLEPLAVDLKVEPLSVTSDSKSLIDLKPVVVDSCQTIKLAPLPPIHMEQPYSQHFGFTFMGMELFGFTMSGKSEVRLHSPRNAHPCGPHDDEGEAEHHRTEAAPSQGNTRSAGGLRVRVSDDL